MFFYLVFVGAGVNMLGGASYIRDTFLGKVQPNRMTRVMWSIAPLIATAAGIASGAGWAVLPVFMSGFLPLLILMASFFNPKAYWKLGKMDYVCGVLSLLALILWGLSSNPSIAIVFAIMSDGIAWWPTMLKSWRRPETESAFAYATGMFGAMTAFSAIHEFNFTNIGFPLYLIVANALLVFAIKRDRFMPTNIRK